MTEQLDQELPKIGYVFHYPRLDHPVDKFRLDIFITEVATKQHFDVLRAYFSIRGPRGNVEQIKITHPWIYAYEYSICAGVVILEDRMGKKEEAFTFGGQLTVDVKNKMTACSLVSSAPILDISSSTLLNALFIEELEVLFAEHRCESRDEVSFDLELCKADPLILYTACLKELIQKFTTFPDKTDKYLQLLAFLLAEEHRLETAGLYRKSGPSLHDIFKE